MKNDINRRTALKYMAAGAAATGIGATQSLPQAEAAALPTLDSWKLTHDRVWLGGAYWANPMEDWRIVEGRAECQNLAGNRNIQSLTHQITNPAGSFEMSVDVKQVEIKGQDGGAGFRVGTKSEINEFRSNCFARNGIDAGIIGKELVLGPKKTSIAKAAKDYSLTLTGRGEDGKVILTLEARAADGVNLGALTATYNAPAILGNVAVVSNFSPDRRRRGQNDGPNGRARYSFANWKLSGDAFTVKPEQKFGPILWSMYSLSDSRSDESFVLKISALTGPMGDKDSKDVELHVEQKGSWKSLGKAKLDKDAWTATFRIPNWNEKEATPYKLVYREKHTDGSVTPDEWTGTIKPNPSGRPLRMAALTCQNDYGFPYEPVANNVKKLDPDLAYFSGDQIYESHGGYGIIREPADPAILNYLRKFYQFGWSFREVMRDCPTLCLPDDHDVFQGNIWGEGGAKMDTGDGGASSKGGYIEPAKMVNVVHITNCAHHPDPFDPKPVKQDISVYYGDMVYGGVSFAIIADRQWKSGPERVETGSGRADHVLDRNFDCSKLDKPGLVLLGERQEEFLKQWAKDWRGHKLKVVLSQTVFAGVATHHGGYDSYLQGDLDSGAWPQTARNRAVDILRPSMALHINGDQHLTTLTQYGTKGQRNANWSFCTPAIAAGYPRWWRPDEENIPHANRPKHGLPNTGEFIDSFGNNVYMYAVGNPEVGKAPNRYDKAHEKGSGFGFVTFDTEKKTYYIESFRFLIDATDGKPSNQFPGWPVTIHQTENRGENKLA